MQTPASVEKELRKLARSERIEFYMADLTGQECTAMLVWGSNGLPDRILLDPYLGGLIESTIHELLHIHQKRPTKDLGKELEEAHMEAFEDRVVRYVNRSDKRIQWWRRCIAKRLP